MQDGQPFLRIERPCKCTWMCCNRPEATVILTENGQEKRLGSVVNNWACCGISMTTKNIEGVDRLKIYGSIC